MVAARRLAATLGVVACGGGPPDAAPPSPGPAPLTATTTSAEIARANLDRHVEGLRVRWAATADPAVRRRLVDRLLTRATFYGRLADRDEALALAAEARAGGHVDDVLLHARVLQSLHRFAEAEDALEAAATLGADTAVARARLDVARHARLPEALATLTRDRDRHPTYDRHVAVAAAQRALGHFDEAEAAFLAAADTLRDVSPFPLAWIDFQRGVMWAEHAGRADHAEPLYRAAVRRLPRYVVANVHLAELEPAADAVARLRRVAAHTDDPEPHAVLAERLRATDAEAADAAAHRARAGYERHLARHEAAFAHHAVEFFLAEGADPQRALHLARADAAARPSPTSRATLVEAALAAGEPATACEQVASPPHPVLPAWTDAVAATRGRCDG